MTLGLGMDGVTVGRELSIATTAANVGDPPWGSGSAPLAVAPVVVAARPRPALRLAPLRQTPTAADFGNYLVGNANCR